MRLFVCVHMCVCVYALSYVCVSVAETVREAAL